ncbi:MAG: DUF5067 domain-containing protein [Lachnospiraceae bacterium]|nr:DUF5067 domain-containing protein [Lachnospiraceae bacterium]
MGNEDTNTSGRMVKERTVKKKAARSIVAPRADEETAFREARRKEAFTGMNKDHVTANVKKSNTLVSPNKAGAQEIEGSKARMLTAPIQLTWNEDASTSKSQKSPERKMATGWPDSPPKPRNIEKERKELISGSSVNNVKTDSIQENNNLQPPYNGPGPVFNGLKEDYSGINEKMQGMTQELQLMDFTLDRYTPDAVKAKSFADKQKSLPLEDREQTRMVPSGNNNDRKDLQAKPDVTDTAKAGQKPVIKTGPGQNPANKTAAGPKPVNKTVAGSKPVNKTAAGPKPVNKTAAGPKPVNKTARPEPVNKTAAIGTRPVNKTAVRSNQFPRSDMQQNRIKTGNYKAVNYDGINSGTGVVTEQTRVLNTVSNVEVMPVNKEEYKAGKNPARKILKTIVTTTTTTTYEAVSEDDMNDIIVSGDPITDSPKQIDASEAARRAAASMTGELSKSRTVYGNEPVGGQNIKSSDPVGSRVSNVNEQARKQSGNNRALAQRRSVNSQKPVRNNPGKGSGEPSALSSREKNVLHGNGKNVKGPMQGSMIDRMMSQPANKPVDPQKMSSMDKQLADIEKALGLSEEAKKPAVVPPVAPNVLPPQTKPVTVNEPDVNGSIKAPLQKNKDVFDGIDSFQESKDFSITEMEGEKKKSKEYLMLAIEAIIFVIILCVCISIYKKIKSDEFVPGTSIEDNVGESESQEALDNTEYGDQGTEAFEVEEAGVEDELLPEDDQGTDMVDDTVQNESTVSQTVDVDNENFTLKCTNVTVVLDSNGNPAALIYFTFVNKTSKLLSMSEVYPPSVTQNGEVCETSASLNEYPEEYYNKDTQISDGSSLNCAYAVSLKDAVSAIRLTIYDNYETFAEVGSIEIQLQ